MKDYEDRYEWCADGIDIWDNMKEERIDYDFPVLLNQQYKQIEALRHQNDEFLDEIADVVLFQVKLQKVLQSFSERDLVEIERIFLENLCKELGVELE